MGTFGAGYYYSLCREDYWDVCGGNDAYDSSLGPEKPKLVGNIVGHDLSFLSCNYNKNERNDNSTVSKCFFFFFDDEGRSKIALTEEIKITNI
jgi:hypothetical protein